MHLYLIVWLTALLRLHIRHLNLNQHLCIVKQVVGFGRFEQTNRNGSEVLRHVRLPVADTSLCSGWRSRRLLPSEICAGISEGGERSNIGAGRIS